MSSSSRVKRYCVILLVALLSIAWFPRVSYGAEPFILEPYARIAKQASGDSAYQYVDRLTRDDFEARLAGSEGCDKAADWIADEFSNIGLTPFRADSYFQPLEVPYFNLMPPFQLRYREGKQWINPEFRKDFIVFHYSGRGKVSNQCVFVGYGVQASDQNYNDFEGISVTHKTAFMLVDLPTFLQDKKETFSIYNRIDTAFQYGASSIVLLSKSPEVIPFRFDRKMAMGFDAKIPVLITHPYFSRALLAPSNLTLDGLIQTIEMTQKPKSFLINTVMEIEINFVMEQRISNNVIGYIPATDPTVKESILITSHYDGLGIDYLENTMYHGANDNASSTGCVMEIARTLKNNNILPAVNIVFIAFTGEEVGLCGSYYYTRNPLFPLQKIKAVLNMEEVGTVEGINIVGTSRSIYPELGKLIYESAKFLKTKVTFYPELLYPGSDHWPFHERGIPSVCFAKLPMPDGYPEYHKLTDTIDIISPQSLEIFCHLITLMTLSFAKTAFFDFSEFPKDTDSLHPFLAFSGSCYLPSDHKLTLYVNHQKQTFPISNLMALFVPLSSGENKIVIEIKYKNKTWIQNDYSISCFPDKNLRADFNQDLRIDVLDLFLLSKKMDLRTELFHYDSLYDLNQDQIISMEDFKLFENSFDFKLAN